MKITRDQLLKHIGIIQWTLWNSMVMCGEYKVFIPNFTKLLVISEKRINLNDFLVKDILRAMMINSDQVYCLLTSKALSLPKEVFCPCWIIGQNLLAINSKRWIIHTASLEDIYLDHKLKYNLWMQICKYKDNFEFKTRLI